MKKRLDHSLTRSLWPLHLSTNRNISLSTKKCSVAKIETSHQSDSPCGEIWLVNDKTNTTITVYVQTPPSFTRRDSSSPALSAVPFP